MADVVIYDKNTNWVKEFRRSVHTPDYQGRDDAVIFFKRSVEVPSCEQKHWVYDAGKIREMTTTEKAVRDAAELEDRKKQRKDSAYQRMQSFSEEKSFLSTHFTNTELIELARNRDEVAKFILLVKAWKNADTVDKKAAVLAKAEHLEVI